jgi:hypothetical protein
MKTIIKKVVGVILIIYGIFALLTPFTPGSWLAIIGMELLGIHLVIFDRFLPEKQRAALRKLMAKFHVSQPASSDNSKGDLQERCHLDKTVNKAKDVQDTR